MLKANFHTHTYRCNHATGTEREYIEEAIKNGLKVLGFSDHTPYLFDNGYISAAKMLPEEFDGYVKTILKLKEEYKKDIDIYLGVEAEYYPKLFYKTYKFMEGKIDYMILGQHCTYNEYDGKWVAGGGVTENDVLNYVEEVLEGLDTGLFSYVAHPDVPRLVGNDDFLFEQISSILIKEKELGLPAEFNLLGFITDRHYPSKKYIEQVKKIGNKIIYGVDAHSTEMVTDCQKYALRADEFLKDYNIERTEHIKLINGKTI